MNILKSLHSWMFGYGSPVTIGFLRAILGSLVFINLAMLTFDFEAWFTERGYYPVHLLEHWSTGFERFSLIQNVTNDTVTAVFFGLTMLAALTTALGLHSRVSSVLLFIGLTSIHHRSPEILNSGDTLLRAMTFYVALAPSGAACSFDRLIGLWKGTVNKVHEEVSLWPQRLMQIQLAIVYFMTVWLKWFGEWWRDGTATWYVPQLQELDRFPAPSWIDQPPMIQITTYGTLVVELALASLVFYKPTRKFVLILGIALHAFIEYRFNIPLYALIITSFYISHYEGSELTAWVERLGARLKRFRITVVMPKGLESNDGPAVALQATDPLGLVTYQTSSADSWSSTDVDGNKKNWVLSSLLRSIGAWLLWLYPPAWKSILSKAFRPLEAKSSGD